ncbi:MAG: polysaccharide deacetylase family protein [Clostridia bacterium]|nr:polysaccharide deacetylase family protein [Clostridia bacterium]
MSLDNTRSGHGWLHSENRQSYFDRFGALTTADRSQPVVYLTFDEGYENGYTPTILDTLAEKGVKVVFFITMDYAKKNAALVQRMIQEGHAVGNHSTTHPSFPSLSVKAACAEVQQLHDYVQQHFNYTMHLFRFPSGDHSDRMLATLQSLGYTSVFWNFAHRDWDPADQPTYEETLSRILANTQNGTIYLLHAVSASDTAVLGQAIDEIRARGYSFGLLP